jgi:hypothetical protein
MVERTQGSHWANRSTDNREMGKRGILTHGERKCDSQAKGLWRKLERGETSAACEKTDIFLRTKRV